MRCRGQSKFLGLQASSGINEDLSFLGIGICVGYAIIVPSTICSYIVSKYEVTFMVNYRLVINDWNVRINVNTYAA